MFEKESEEYREKEKDKGYYWVTQEMEQSELDTIIDESFKDGAEFGYNKAKEDANKMKSRFLELCNLKDMRIEKLEKANEWHYVKDGDLPKKNGQFLLYIEYETSGVRDTELDVWIDKYFSRVTLEDKKIIAWKEIVLPKE